MDMFEKIIELIKETEYTKAIEKIEDIIENNNISEKDLSYANHLLGCIYNDSEYEKRNKYKAKKHFLKCIKSNFPHPYSYIGYIEDEKDNNIVLNFLKEGLLKFPNNTDLYIHFFSKSNDKEEKIIYAEKVKELGIENYDLFCNIIELYLTYNLTGCEYYSKKLISMHSCYKDDKYVFKLILAFSLAFQEDINKLDEAENIIIELIKDDIENTLCYAHYLCLIFIYIKKKENKYLLYFDKLPLNSLEDYIYPPILIDFSDIYKVIFSEIYNVFKNDKNRKIKAKALYTMYKCKQRELFDNTKNKPSKHWLKNLVNYHKNNLHNSAVTNEIIKLQIYFEMAIDAYNLFVEEYIKINTELSSYLLFDILEIMAPSELEQTCNDFYEKLNNIHMGEKFLKEIISPLIDFLFNTKKIAYKKYEIICKISDLVSIEKLKTTNKLFECAYSYNEIGNVEKAKELYLEELKLHPNSSASLNNLGVIYANKENHELSKYYYEKANEISPNKKLYINNLSNAKNNLKKAKNKELKKLTKNLNIQYFENIGYNQELIKLFDNIKKENLKKILLSDLNECAVCIACKQYKSAMVISGSIVEALLVEKITSKNIDKYNINNKNKKIKDMSLNELLSVAVKENIISTTTEHLTHFIKDYRNLIHPLRLISKDYKTNEEDMMVTWNILKKIITDFSN